MIRIVDFSFLGAYLFLENDWRVSILWVLAFPLIAFSVAWLIGALKVANRFPCLNHRILYPSSRQAASAPLSDDEWALEQAKYLESGMCGLALLSSPSEDGLICVPVSMVGLGLVTATIGGAVFGLLHLGRFTYLECIGKGIYYTLTCLFILPHGILNIVFGHLLMNLFGLIVIKVGRHVLSKKVTL